MSLEDITVEFTNDLYDPATDYDRNLTVRSVVVTDIESGQSDTGIPGSDNVFSTGTYLAEDGVAPGLGRGSTLHTNGLFQFFASDDNPRGFAIDSAFGDNGQVQLQEASDLLELPDGRFAVNVVTGGNRTGTASDLIYFTADGQVDTSRGENGRVSLFGFAGAGVNAFDDGSILVSSTLGPSSTTTFTKLDPNGNVDSSFGVNGSIDVATTTTPRVAVTPDDGFLVAGAFFSVDFRAEDVLRFNSDGQLDTNFGAGGTARFEEVLQFRQVLVSDSGDLFVISDSSFTTTAEVFKLTPDGQRDLSFGDSGVFVIGPNADAVPDETLFSDVQLDSQGRLLFAEEVDDDNVRLVRVNSDGTVDNSFSSPQLPRPISSFVDFEFDIDAADRVVGPFNEVVDTDSGFDVTRSIFRLTSDGSLESTFAQGGLAFVSQENSIEFSDVDTEGIAVLADGSLLLLNENDVSRFFV